jgi:hypothetical protein
MGPAGRVHCSLPDWAKFVADQLLGARSGRALLWPQTYTRLHASPFRDELYTPGGWKEESVFGAVLLAHDGCNTMNYAIALLWPSRDCAVLVATNQGTVKGPGQKGAHEAAEALSRQYPFKK